MEALFEKIYSEIIVHQKDVKAALRTMEQQNVELAMQFRAKSDEEERDSLADLLDDIAVSAGKEGFYLGFCYAFGGMLALLKE